MSGCSAFWMSQIGDLGVDPFLAVEEHVVDEPVVLLLAEELDHVLDVLVGLDREVLRVLPDDVGLLLLPHLDAGLPQLEEGHREVLVLVVPLLGGHEVVAHDVLLAVGLGCELVVELERHLAAVHDLDLAGAQLRDRRLRDDRGDLAVAAEQVRRVHEVVVDLEVEVTAADPVVQAVHLLGEHAPERGVRRRAGDADRRPLGHVGQRLVGVACPPEQRHAQVVVLAEGDRLDAGLRLEHRRLPRRHRHDVAVTAGEVGELVPGRARLDPGVVLLLPVRDHPLVLHHVPDRLGGEREPDHPLAVALPSRRRRRPPHAAAVRATAVAAATSLIFCKFKAFLPFSRACAARGRRVPPGGGGYRRLLRTRRGEWPASRITGEGIGPGSGPRRQSCRRAVAEPVTGRVDDLPALRGHDGSRQERVRISHRSTLRRPIALGRLLSASLQRTEHGTKEEGHRATGLLLDAAAPARPELGRDAEGGPRRRPPRRLPRLPRRLHR